ncbi:MAG: hypothetical protein RLZZ301_274 [Bacteroidota bacterium]|jgi:Mg/Co/Ni transporter MgtE
MRAFELITEEIPPLVHSDSGEKALKWMDEFRVTHLPVLKNGNFVGLVSESDILDQPDPSQSLDHLFQHLPRPFVFADVHLFEVLQLIANYKLSVVPVLDRQENYLGATTVFELMSRIASATSMNEPGAILVLEVNVVDYSLAQIAQIVESNNARILSVFCGALSDSTKLDVTLKINQLDLSAIIRTFERYDYQVKARFQDNAETDDLKTRYDELMHYLSM